MILSIIIGWLVVGYVSVCLIERNTKEEHPTYLVLFGLYLFMVFVFMVMAEFISKTIIPNLNMKTKPSKLRKFLRGF